MTITGRDLAQRALLAGEGLSAATIQWGRRPEPPPPLALTDRDLRLMALLHGANFLSTSQLAALGWRPSRERPAQMRLKRLHDSGYVDRFRPASAYGRAEWNYRLTSLGWSALREREMVAAERRYTPTALTSISYAEHDLQLASIVLHIARDAAGDGEEALIGQMPFRWQGPRNGRIEIDGDGETERSPAAQLPPDTRIYPAGSRTGLWGAQTRSWPLARPFWGLLEAVVSLALSIRGGVGAGVVSVRDVRAFDGARVAVLSLL